MNCSEVLDLLSPLHDEELSTDLCESVEQHLRECPACAAVRADFGAMSSLINQQPDPEPPAELWNHIQSEMHSYISTSSVASDRMRFGFLRRPRRLLGVVAATLVAVLGIAFIIHETVDHGHDEHLAVNFDRFLNEFPTSPEQAQKLLHANYPSNLVDVDQAELEVKYRPAVANALPTGYTLDSVHLVRMPCCLCVEALCTTPYGTRLAVLEHAIDQPVWFGDRPVEQCNCNGRNARLIRFDGQLVATWKSEKRFLTIIGIRNEDELTNLMKHLDPPEA
tara:strand:+ start:8838 stop:9674 length:837 start_codon:yes stop_codon:yes gene_type:complete